MTPEEFLEIYRNLAPEERAACEMDKRLYGKCFIVKLTDGTYRRAAPEDVKVQRC